MQQDMPTTMLGKMHVGNRQHSVPFPRTLSHSPLPCPPHL